MLTLRILEAHTPLYTNTYNLGKYDLGGSGLASLAIPHIPVFASLVPTKIYVCIYIYIHINIYIYIMVVPRAPTGMCRTSLGARHLAGIPAAKSPQAASDLRRSNPAQPPKFGRRKL